MFGRSDEMSRSGEATPSAQGGDALRQGDDREDRWCAEGPRQEGSIRDVDIVRQALIVERARRGLGQRNRSARVSCVDRPEEKRFRVRPEASEEWAV